MESNKEYSLLLSSRPFAVNVLRLFYEVYNPSKVDSIESILDCFSGQEIQMFQQLCDKYNVEDSVFRSFVEKAYRRYFSPPDPTSLANEQKDTQIAFLEEKVSILQSELVDARAALTNSDKELKLLKIPISLESKSPDLSSLQMGEFQNSSDRHCDNLHQQLASLIALNQCLGAQVRSLSSRLIELQIDNFLVRNDEETLGRGASSAKSCISIAQVIDSVLYALCRSLANNEASFGPVSLGQLDEFASEANLLNVSSTQQTSFAIMASNIASRVELRDTLAQLKIAENALVEQRLQFEIVSKKIQRLTNGTGAIPTDESGPFADNQLHQKEIERLQTMLALSENNHLEKDRSLREVIAELAVLREEVAASRSAQREMQSMLIGCARTAEDMALAYIDKQSGVLNTEMESQLQSLEFSFRREREVRVEATQEMHRELNRLREELILCASEASSKDELISHLQLQLSNAADM